MASNAFLQPSRNNQQINPKGFPLVTNHCPPDLCSRLGRKGFTIFNATWGWQWLQSLLFTEFNIQHRPEEQNTFPSGSEEIPVVRRWFHQLSSLPFSTYFLTGFIIPVSKHPFSHGALEPGMCRRHLLVQMLPWVSPPPSLPCSSSSVSFSLRWVHIASWQRKKKKDLL